jgi:uncharacterized protein (DUF305 family)
MELNHRTANLPEKDGQFCGAATALNRPPCAGVLFMVSSPLQNVIPRLSRGALGALALCLAAPLVTAARAQDPMAGHKHGAINIVVPPGAPYTRADVEFMQGMIAHHAQAIVMSRMAESHKANPRLLKLAMKIDQSQMPEIQQMQGWLRYYKQEAPDTSSWRTMHMDGMLTEKQMKELDAAQGVEFDRAFLNYMIMHHEGALKMVADLFASPLAGQEVDIGIFANDVVTAQTAEIGIMRQMLSQLPPVKK